MQIHFQAPAHHARRIAHAGRVAAVEVVHPETQEPLLQELFAFPQKFLFVDVAGNRWDLLGPA